MKSSFKDTDIENLTANGGLKKDKLNLDCNEVAVADIVGRYIFILKVAVCSFSTCISFTTWYYNLVQHIQYMKYALLKLIY